MNNTVYFNTLVSNTSEARKLDTSFQDNQVIRYHAGSDYEDEDVAANGTVDPIRNVEDIQKVKNYLLTNLQFRNYALFVFGINIGLRASDLLRIKVSDVSILVSSDYNGHYVYSVNPDAAIRVKEKKTKKYRFNKLNQSIKNAIQLYLDNINTLAPTDYLFTSPRSHGDHITVRQMNNIMKEIQKSVLPDHNLGTHSLRKTFGYHLFMNNQKTPTILAYLQDIFNHSSPAITLRYIGMTQEKKDELFMNLNL